MVTRAVQSHIEWSGVTKYGDTELLIETPKTLNGPETSRLRLAKTKQAVVLEFGYCHLIAIFSAVMFLPADSCDIDI